MWTKTGDKMPGIIYVLLIFLLGRELVPKAGRTRLWLFLPASFGLGALAMGWTSYAAGFCGRRLSEVGKSAFLRESRSHGRCGSGSCVPLCVPREKESGYFRPSRLGKRCFFFCFWLFSPGSCSMCFTLRTGSCTPVLRYMETMPPTRR